jgi:phage tail-like protein
VTTPDKQRSAAPGNLDPVMSNRFQLAIDGVPIGWFMEVSGLEMVVEVESFPEGGQNGFVHKFPGRTTWPNLVFKRGITQDDNLMAWVRKSSGEGFAASKNKLARPTGAVSIIDHQGHTLRSWSLISPFPVRWTGPRLSANEFVALNEEVEVAHHGFTTSTTASW